MHHYYTKRKQKHKVLPKNKEELREVLDEKVAEFLLNSSSEIQKVRKGFSGLQKKMNDDVKKLYHDYVTSNSEEWKSKKEETFERRGRCCQICESADNLQVHHNNYNCLLFESVDNDLVVLCRDCHHHFHSHIPAKNLGKFRHKKTNCSFCSSNKRPMSTIVFGGGEKRPLVYICYKCQNIFKEKLSDTGVVAKIESRIRRREKKKRDRLILKEKRVSVKLRKKATGGEENG